MKAGDTLLITPFHLVKNLLMAGDSVEKTVDCPRIQSDAPRPHPGAGISTYSLVCIYIDLARRVSKQYSIEPVLFDLPTDIVFDLASSPETNHFLHRCQLVPPAAAAALRARSLVLRGALALRVSFCFSRLLFRLSLRLPIKISFYYFLPNLSRYVRFQNI